MTDPFKDLPDAERMRLAVGTQIPDLISELQDALTETGRDPQRAALSGPLTSWTAAEPESRAAILLNAAWAARDALSVPRPPDREAEGYALALVDLAKGSPNFAVYHGERFPSMPLPGQAGALASSLAFDRDDLAVSLETALILIADIPE